MTKPLLSHQVHVMEGQKKRIAPNGNRLPDPIREGEIFTDVTKKQWRLGRSIGTGGFGEIYLASDNISKPVGPDAQYVIKVESHSNGPLFVEMNFYLRTAKEEMIEDWRRKMRLKHLGIPRYLGFGSHTYCGLKFRFLVLDRLAQDLDKLFLQCSNKFHLKTAMYIGIQILDTLEYIHSHGYVHADIKGSNLMVDRQRGKGNNVFLLDYGLACRYIGKDGRHKEYWEDQRKAHNGTIEYTSRDAHIGAHSRRGDLENLGYNLVRWLCGQLPWEQNISDPEYVHLQKKTFMSNISQLMRVCFPNSDPPVVLSQYLKYVANLGFDTKPDYKYCRSLLRQGVIDSGFQDNSKLDFGKCPAASQAAKKGKKRSCNEPENIALVKPAKIVRYTVCQPCKAHNFNIRMTRNSPTSVVLRSHQNFSWEKILSGNPEKPMKKASASARRVARKASVEPAGQTQLVGRTATNRLRQRRKSDTPEPAPVQEVAYSAEEFSNPTPAMLEVVSKRKQRELSTSGIGKKFKSDSRCSSPIVESPYPFPITPAMEQVLRRREELKVTAELTSSEGEEGSGSNSEGEASKPPPKKRGRRKQRARPKSKLLNPMSDHDATAQTHKLPNKKKKQHGIQSARTVGPARSLRKNTLRG